MASKRPGGWSRHFAGRGRGRGARHIMRLKEPVGAFDLRPRSLALRCACDVHRLSARDMNVTKPWLWYWTPYKGQKTNVGSIVFVIAFIE